MSSPRTGFRSRVSALWRLCGAGLIGFGLVDAVHAQPTPGPYEYLPYQEGFILEAFRDLLPGASIADWTGETASQWVSPGAYNGHEGTDVSVQTGTPLFAVVAGTVAATESSYAINTHPPATGYYGNYVKIACDTPGPNGEAVDVIYAHMMSVSVSVGQHVTPGVQVGLSDNTGQSDSEHVHFQSEVRGASQTNCPFYNANFKYPIVHNIGGNLQIGRVVKIMTTSTPIRTDRFDTSTQISTAWQNQLYFASYAKRGYYQVFIPNQTSYRSGWVRATDVEEFYTGTVIQPLPDNVTYTHLGQLAAKYPMRSSPSDAAGQIGLINFGGGKFVADQITNGYYRIPLPTNSAAWGWVKTNSRLVVYSQLINSNINISAINAYANFPIRDNFTTVGKSTFGRPKFGRMSVKSFSPSSPGGDGKALFITDATNAGTGLTESALVGKPGHTNYFVQCDVYFNFQPAYISPDVNWERYGVFLRDDGYAGFDQNYEGGGNDYALIWDNDDGRLRACKFVDAVLTDLRPVAGYIAGSGWHTMRIEARGSQITFKMDGTNVLQITDTTFASGQCGIGYRWTTGNSSYPATRGAYFDNFVADLLDPPPPHFDGASVKPDGKLHLLLGGHVGTTNLVEKSSTLTNWSTFTNVVIGTNGTVEILESDVNSLMRFYRAKRVP